MKNLRIILLAGICFQFLTTTAQLQPGIKAGLNYAGLSGYNGDNLLSFHAGVFVPVMVSKNWRIQPELLYSGEGQHYLVYDNNETTTPIRNTIALNYIQLPLVVQYFPLPSLFFEAGPQLAVLASAFSKGLADGHMNVKRSFTNTEFGLNLGAGVLLNQQIGIYGRYCFGLTDVTPYNSVANRSQTGQLGISFLLKHKRNAPVSIAKPGSENRTD
ncbi:MAG TPA: porin family protein [Chitinophagaceae bacterium]